MPAGPPPFALSADPPADPRVAAALRRLAQESGACILCERRRCRRSGRCRGPWERSVLAEGGLPACLALMLDLDSDSLDALQGLLADFAGRIEEAKGPRARGLR